ncbi:tyrosine-type recombinase/integrase [Coleofasciculus sp. FACHB-64]|uniref:tyrosine-type recombinase/integrase n=1 Tax=Cyanophyceae TaxID=3028117 RepID=UPI001683075C|nr:MULTISPECIES: tyrosine-type recombinase/integrase [unclassified Coleofasciculus]MBD1840951.1 tyrosine-type recombinase/integrase [Coleofasciculus sp. FACHB-501]MBD2046074.1 tyrosine-type recombinase/integrase [Coleofasciculus sp. FACHB-64]MBD2087528.1 tyrosine-type recombinase/integrase [Coleofasciculus sp. FACHB-542]
MKKCPSLGVGSSLLYGTGMRRGERLRLRVKDIDFGSKGMMIRDRIEAENCITMLLKQLVEPLRQHLQYARSLHFPITR